MIVNLGTSIESPKKVALPIDFTKAIKCNRGDLLPKMIIPILHDKFDVEIENGVQIPQSDETNQVNINMGNLSTQKLVRVTKLSPGQAKILFNGLPIRDLNSSGNVPVNVTPTVENPTLNNDVTDNTICTSDTENPICNNNQKNITHAGSLHTGNLEKETIEGSERLTDVPNDKVPVNDSTTDAQKTGNVVKDIVPTSNVETENTESNQHVADIGKYKLVANIRPSIASVTTENLTISNRMIENTGPNLTCTGKNTETNTQIVTTNASNPQNISTVPKIIYTVIETSAGSFLVPLSVLQRTNTVNSITTPMVSTGATTENTVRVSNNNITIVPNKSLPGNKNDSIADDTHEHLENHCKCCIVLRKICKEKQKYITDFFAFVHTKPYSKAKENSCECTDRKYPKATKRLKLFLKNFKNATWCVHKELQSTLQCVNKELEDKEQASANNLLDNYSLEDIGK